MGNNSRNHSILTFTWFWLLPYRSCYFVVESFTHFLRKIGWRRYGCVQLTGYIHGKPDPFWNKWNIYSLFSKHVIRWLVKFYSESAPDQLTESRLPHIILTEFLIMNDKGKLYKECLFTRNLTDTESYLFQSIMLLQGHCECTFSRP